MQVIKSRVVRIAALVAILALVPALAGSASAQSGDCDPPPPQAPQSASPAYNSLEAGSTMLPGDSISSPDGDSVLIFQDDSNLVFLQSGKAVWASGTSGANAAALTLQLDGNFVMSRPGVINAVLWYSGTATEESGAAELRVGDDGPAVIVDTMNTGEAADDVELWSVGNKEVSPPPNATEIGEGHIVPGSFVNSPNGRVTLIYQGDGNLVVVHDIGDAERLSISDHTGTNGRGDVLVLKDGNLSMQEGGTHTTVWQSGTSSDTDTVLRVQDNGVVTVQEKDGDGYGDVLWSLGEPLPLPPVLFNKVDAVAMLSPGYEISSPDGCNTLRFQADGNLVLYREKDSGPEDRVAVWESGTSFERDGDRYARSEVLVMQDDGNLVLYQILQGASVPATALWHTGTHGNAGAYLAVQDDGRITIRTDKEELWSAGAEIGSRLWSLPHRVGAANASYLAAATGG